MREKDLAARCTRNPNGGDDDEEAELSPGPHPVPFARRRDRTRRNKQSKIITAINRSGHGNRRQADAEQRAQQPVQSHIETKKARWYFRGRRIRVRRCAVRHGLCPVSYTHLTLPTIYSV